MTSWCMNAGISYEQTVLATQSSKRQVVMILQVYLQKVQKTAKKSGSSSLQAIYRLHLFAILFLTPPAFLPQDIERKVSSLAKLSLFIPFSKWNQAKGHFRQNACIDWNELILHAQNLSNLALSSLHYLIYDCSKNMFYVLIFFKSENGTSTSESFMSKSTWCKLLK